MKFHIEDTVDKFTCSNCKASTPMYAPGLATHVLCKSCGFHTALVSNYQPDRINDPATLPKPVIEVGQELKLDAINWRCISFSEYKEHGTSYRWREYGLYDRQTNALAWLAEYDGHWSLCYPYEYYLEKPGASVIREGLKTYLLYARYNVDFKGGYGEYTERLSKDSLYRTFEFINPPEMIAVSKNKQESFATHARYLPKKELQAALPANTTLPETIGTGAIEPASAQISTSRLKWIAILTILILLIVELVANSAESEIKVAYRRVNRDSSVNATVPFILKDIDLPENYNNVEVRISSDLNNEWAEIQGTLVTATGNDVASFGTAVEYYSGMDDEGSWSEGSSSNSVFLPSLEKGSYTLNGEVLFGTTRPGCNVYIEVYANVPYIANLWFMILLALIFPVYMLIRMFYKNKQRWNNSDFAHEHFNWAQ